MRDKIFLDSNILIYAICNDKDKKNKKESCKL